MKAIQLLSHWTDRVCRYFMVALMGLAFIFTIYQVLSRYVVQSSWMAKVLSEATLAELNFPWMEELIRYLFVWIVFLGVGIVYKLKGHAYVEIVINFLSPAWKRRVSILVEAINAVFFVILFLKGLDMLKITNVQVSPSLQINMAYMYVSIVACSVICFIHSVCFFVQGLAGKEIKIGSEGSSHSVPAENIG